jgi:hypothetical protein
MIDEADRDGDGVISEEEFYRYGSPPHLITVFNSHSTSHQLTPMNYKSKSNSN